MLIVSRKPHQRVIIYSAQAARTAPAKEINDD
jgi:hypothetical protein